ncbi:hypothetical protein QTP86_011075 [Hemibagrus guttatus]|nr:hypothetical protein QTP86_011075 [Hemibagrus guttatus]
MTVDDTIKTKMYPGVCESGFRMKILLVFTFFLIIAGTDAVTTVTGYRGRSVQIKCSYEAGYENHIKYLCRGECPYGGNREIPVRSGSPAKDTRFSLHDNTTARVFIITITDLRPADEGTYWCVTQRILSDIYTEILLLVITDDPTISSVSPTTHFTPTHDDTTHSVTGFPTTPVIIAVSVVVVMLIVAFIIVLQWKMKTQGSETVTQAAKEVNAKDFTSAGTDAVTTVTGYRGRSVQIKCSYEAGYENHIKYLCRGECPYVVNRDIPVRSGSPAKDTRFSLHDNTTARVFIITITDLRPADEGTYWCVTQRILSDSYTEILLLVKTDDPTISSVSPTTHFTPTHDDTTHSVTDKAVNYTTVTTLSTSSSQGFQTTPVIIAVSVVLVLLLIALLFTVAIQRKKKTQVLGGGHLGVSGALFSRLTAVGKKVFLWREVLVLMDRRGGTERVHFRDERGQLRSWLHVSGTWRHTALGEMGDCSQSPSHLLSG